MIWEGMAQIGNEKQCVERLRSDELKVLREEQSEGFDQIDFQYLWFELTYSDSLKAQVFQNKNLFLCVSSSQTVLCASSTGNLFPPRHYYESGLESKRWGIPLVNGERWATNYRVNKKRTTQTLTHLGVKKARENRQLDCEPGPKTWGLYEEGYCQNDRN